MSETKDNLEEILRKKREAEEKAAQEEAEASRQAYLRRTNRREMKP